MPNVFSPATLDVFEDASASIPLRQIDRVFAGAGIRLGAELGGFDGARRTQFRRYVTDLDQRDPRALAALGAALGALIEEVAASKQEFLVNAAERDGFLFADGVFRPAENGPQSFVVTRVEDLASIDERCRRLQRLTDDDPNAAVGAAKVLVESVCRTVLTQRGEPAPSQSAALADVAESTVRTLAGVAPLIDHDTNVVRTSVRQLGDIVERLDELRCSRGGPGGKPFSPQLARLAVGAAVTLASFAAETYRPGAARGRRPGGQSALGRRRARA